MVIYEFEILIRESGITVKLTDTIAGILKG
jgi:hypothetical protein